MREGDVVLAPLPQADGQIKNRPALLLRELPPFGDMLICGISTQIHQEVPGFDEILGPKDTDFPSSNLKQESVIRLGFLTVLPKNTIFGTIGAISKERHHRLLTSLARHIGRPVS